MPSEPCWLIDRPQWARAPAILQLGQLAKASVQALACEFRVDLVTQGVAHLDKAIDRAVFIDLMGREDAQRILS